MFKVIYCKVVQQTGLKGKNAYFFPCKSVKSCNTINEINFLCLPSGGSTDDQQNGHKQGKQVQKERRQNDKWKEEMTEREKLRFQKKTHNMKKSNIVILKQHPSVENIYYFRKTLLLSIFPYILGIIVSSPPSISSFQVFTKPSTNFLLILTKPKKYLIYLPHFEGSKIFNHWGTMKLIFIELNFFQIKDL